MVYNVKLTLWRERVTRTLAFSAIVLICGVGAVLVLNEIWARGDFFWAPRTFVAYASGSTWGGVWA